MTGVPVCVRWDARPLGTRGRDPQIPTSRDLLRGLGKVHLLPWKQIAAVNN